MRKYEQNQEKIWLNVIRHWLYFREHSPLPHHFAMDDVHTANRLWMLRVIGVNLQKIVWKT